MQKFNDSSEGVINPDLKSKELQEHFGAINASDLAKILFKTEVPEIATEIANYQVQMWSMKKN